MVGVHTSACKGFDRDPITYHHPIPAHPAPPPTVPTAADAFRRNTAPQPGSTEPRRSTGSGANHADPIELDEDESPSPPGSAPAPAPSARSARATRPARSSAASGFFFDDPIELDDDDDEEEDEDDDDCKPRAPLSRRRADHSLPAPYSSERNCRRNTNTFEPILQAAWQLGTARNDPRKAMLDIGVIRGQGSSRYTIPRFLVVAGLNFAMDNYTVRVCRQDVNNLALPPWGNAHASNIHESDVSALGRKFRCGQPFTHDGLLWLLQYIQSNGAIPSDRTIRQHYNG